MPTVMHRLSYPVPCEVFRMCILGILTAKRVAFTLRRSSARLDRSTAAADRRAQPAQHRHQRSMPRGGGAASARSQSRRFALQRASDTNHRPTAARQRTRSIALTKTPGWARWQALAFLGDVVGKRGARFTELFICELPDDLTQAGDAGPLEGTLTTRPRPPRGCVQRRLTYSEDRPQPGIVTPRHWPRSSPDGKQIFCLMSDAERRPQLFSVSSMSGETKQLTRVDGGVASAFSVSPDGQWIAYVAQGSVMLTSTDGAHTRRLTESVSNDSAPRPEACVVSPDGLHVAFVRRVQSFNQVFVVKI